ncbi:MAG: adenosylcobinamide-GDP ribazoletransferase [Candidatus Bathyarchaeota archaeon]|nr:adenosylcobinamide-GDP ribazoletransferase [Candidatus Bathyarchaeum sp.]
MIIKGLKGLFGFLTILPIGMESMEALSKYFFLCPVVGLVLGAVAGAVGFGASFVLPELICGFLVLVVLQLLTGFHHLDGLLDFSDAAMARGDTKRRLEVMHDMFTGAAAVASGVIVLALTGLAFGSFGGLDILKAAVVAEVIAKESMVLTAYFGKKPSYKGSGYYVVEAMENKDAKMLASVVLCSVVGFVLVGALFVFVLVGMALGVAVLTSHSNKTLESVTGDVMGATNEINRVIALIIMLAIMA